MSRTRGGATLAPMVNRHFVRHYVEMLLAMIAGMVALGAPLGIALEAAGLDLTEDLPAASLLSMAVVMTIPMVAWMRRMGHGWRPCWEMSASMFVPTFGAMALMGAGVIGFGSAMTLEHVVMLPAMLVAMLLRREEYSCGGHHREVHA
jgi:hypothetical protein